MEFTPNLESDDQPAWIGNYPQLGTPPFYYMLSTLPLTFLPTASVDVQLYAVRLVIAFGLGIIGIGLRLARSLYKRRWELPLESLGVMSLLLTGAWAVALGRVTVHIGVVRLFLLAARYATPATISTTFMLCAGWL
jgi:hypothetical protein